MEPRHGQAAERAAAERFADGGHGADGKREAEAHARAVNGGIHNTVLAGIHLGPAEDDAVDNDQRQIHAQRLIQAEGIRLHDQLDDRDEARDDDDVARDAHRVGDDFADGGNGHVGQDQNGGRCNAHAEGRNDRRGDCQRWTGTEDKNQHRVFFDKALQEIL